MDDTAAGALPSIKPEEVEKAADSLSNKFEENIAWYKRNADLSRRRHYQTMGTLTLLSGVTPPLVSVTTALNNSPGFLKWIAVVTTASTGIVIWIRAVWNYQHRWRTFWASDVALMCVRRKYKFERARLGGDINKKFDLIDATYTSLEAYMKDESDRT